MTEKKKLTLKDIAKELGISVSTASRALKEHPDIAKDTIRAVKEYAEAHNYVPNFLAVNFRKTRTLIIGLIVPELVIHFFSTVISGVIDEAKKYGYNVLQCQITFSGLNILLNNCSETWPFYNLYVCLLPRGLYGTLG